MRSSRPARSSTISCVASVLALGTTTSSNGVPTLGAGQLQGSDTVDGLTQRYQSKNVMGAGNSTLEVLAYVIEKRPDLLEGFQLGAIVLNKRELEAEPFRVEQLISIKVPLSLKMRGFLALG